MKRKRKMKLMHKMQNKKTQITIFIIFALVILLIIGFSVMFSKVKGGEKLSYQNTKEIKVFVDECLEQTAAKGVLLLGAQGGYIYPKEDVLATDYSMINYGFKAEKLKEELEEGESKGISSKGISNKEIGSEEINSKGINTFNTFGINTLPSIEFMESEISAYVADAIKKCINDFASLKTKGITAGEIKAKTTISNDVVVVEINYPITVDIGRDKVEKLDKFSVTLPIRLGHIHSIANELVNSLVEEPEWIDMTQMAEYDVKVNAFPHDEEHFVYSIEDDEFLFIFAARFAVNEEPVIKIEAEDAVIKLKDGQHWKYKVDVEDDDSVVFTTDSSLFPISEEGVFDLTPEITGEYEVTITAADAHGSYDKKKVRFIVEE